MIKTIYDGVIAELTNFLATTPDDPDDVDFVMFSRSEAFILYGIVRGCDQYYRSSSQVHDEYESLYRDFQASQKAYDDLMDNYRDILSKYNKLINADLPFPEVE